MKMWQLKLRMFFGLFELSKEQRLKVYERALQLTYSLKDVEYWGLCSILAEADTNYYHGGMVRMEKMAKRFPEIYLHKPKAYSLFWFPVNEEGLKKRREVLRGAIKKLKNETVS